MYIARTSRISEQKSSLVDLLLEPVKPDDWRTSASCAGLDPTLFELPDHSKADDLDRLKQVAEEICTFCPVKQECEDSADREDFKNTIRGGHVPGSGVARGRPRKSVDDLKKPRKTKLRTPRQYDALIDEALAQKYMINGYCRNGHELKRENVAVRNQSRGGRQGYCLVCHRDRAARKRVAWIRDNLSA